VLPNRVWNFEQIGFFDIRPPHASVNRAGSDYNSLQVQFKRRLTDNVQALLSYTWAKSLDTASDESINNFYHRLPEREVLQLKRRSRFEGDRHSGCQHVKRVERRRQKLMKDAQTLCSHPGRNLR